MMDTRRLTAADLTALEPPGWCVRSPRRSMVRERERL